MPETLKTKIPATTERSKPLVSVLVVTYNQEAYIARTLDSLLAQQCAFSYEILIGEDCSGDQTRTICLSYAARYPERIRLYLNKKNKGLIQNYFDLLRQAKGKYLADCGGDDYWISTTKLQQQVSLLEQYPEITMVCGNYQSFHQQTGVLKPNQLGLTTDLFSPERSGRQAVIDYLNEDHFPRVVLSTACFRADVLKRQLKTFSGHFTGERVVCEDLPITLALLMKGPFYFMQEEVMVYRVLEQSISHASSIEKLHKSFSVRVLIQTLYLTQYFGITSRELNLFLKKKLPDLFYTGFITADKNWINDLLNELKPFSIRLSVKQRLMCLLVQRERLTRFLVRLVGKQPHQPNQPTNT